MSLEIMSEAYDAKVACKPFKSPFYEQKTTTTAVVYDKILTITTFLYTTCQNYNYLGLPPRSQGDGRRMLNFLRYSDPDESLYTAGSTSNAENRRFLHFVTKFNFAHIEFNGQKKPERQHAPQAKTSAATDCKQLLICQRSSFKASGNPPHTATNFNVASTHGCYIFFHVFGSTGRTAL